MPKITHSNSETAYYDKDEIFVSNKRIVLGSKTYILDNITSVDLRYIYPNLSAGSMLVLLGIVFFSLGIFLATIHILGFIFILGGVLVAIIGAIIRNQIVYLVCLGSSSGEIDAMSSDDKQALSEIVDAINQAIIEKR